jgi:hypothetical protein
MPRADDVRRNDYDEVTTGESARERSAVARPM